MNKADVTQMILDKKRATGLTWGQIAQEVGLSDVFTTSACLGMNALPIEKAEALARTLGLPDEAATVLAEFPTKIFSQSVPTDPAIYRLYEMVGVYGETIKELINEKAGNGIMSAIDFEMSVDKVPNPKGDRIELKISGKYLEYKSW